MACALTPSYAALCAFRFFVGIGAACAISIVGGVYADTYDDPVSRGRSMATFMVVGFGLRFTHMCQVLSISRQTASALYLVQLLGVLQEL
jgi:MFS family permease